MEKYNFGNDEPYLLARNLVGAQNLEELAIAEQFAFTVRALQFEKGEYQLERFTVETFTELHRHLFQDIYSFAGEIRDVNMSKGNTRFCQMQFIDVELTRFFKELAGEPEWPNLDMAAQRLAYFKSELNMIHPFREGNGRTIRLFIHAFARSKGLDWHYSELAQERYMQAMIQSVYDVSLLEQLFKDTIKSMRD